MKNIAAAIDVGSNSVRLMVAEIENGRVVPVKRGLLTTRLIFGMHNGLLTPEAVERTACAVAQFAETARAEGASFIEAFGTSAMRDARNGETVSSLTEAKCGLRIRVVSGEEEAALAYAGAAPKGRCGIIDIGGGSTEMIAGIDGRALLSQSARIGAVRLMDQLGGRLNPAEMIAAARQVIERHAEAMRACPADRWIGVGGTITTLAAMDKKVDKYTPGAIENHPVTLERALYWLNELCRLSLDERLAIVGLPARRADVIPYGAAILAAVMQELGLSAVHACDHDNLEGYLIRAQSGAGKADASPNETSR